MGSITIGLARYPDIVAHALLRVNSRTDIQAYIFLEQT